MPDFDFEKNAVLDSVDDVPEKYRGVYVQTDEGDNAGKYILDPRVKPIVDAYVGTDKALNQTRADKKKASDESANRRVQLGRYKDVINQLGLEVENEDELPDALLNHINELVDSNKKGKDFKADLEKIRKDHKQALEDAQTEANKKVEKMQNDLFNTKVSDVAVRAITESKGSIDLLLPHIERQCSVIEDDGKYVVRVVDEQGDARMDGKGGWMTVKDLVEEMRASDKYSRAFESEEKGGTGTPPAKNPGNYRKPGEQKTSLEKISAGLASGGAAKR